MKATSSSDTQKIKEEAQYTFLTREHSGPGCLPQFVATKSSIEFAHLGNTAAGQSPSVDLVGENKTARRKDLAPT